MIYSIDATSIDNQTLTVTNKAPTGSLVSGTASAPLTIKNGNSIVINNGKYITINIDSSIPFSTQTVICALSYLGSKLENDISSNMTTQTGSANSFLLMRFNGTVQATQWSTNVGTKWTAYGTTGLASLFAGMSYDNTTNAVVSVIQGPKYVGTVSSASALKDVIPQRTIRIGMRLPSYGAGAGDFELLAYQIYNKPLTPEELESAYIGLYKKYM